MSIEVLREACALVEQDLDQDPTLVLNESELQAVLQMRLLDLMPVTVPAALAPGTLRRPHHPALVVPRVYRELKLDDGRAAMEADLVILDDAQQTVVPKQNGAPKGFAGPLGLVVETKIDTPREKFLMGGIGPSVAGKVAADLQKWSVHTEKGRVRDVAAVVLTPDPSRYQGLPNTLTIRHSPARVQAWDEAASAGLRTLQSAKQAATYAVLAAHALHKLQPVGLIREKDFESRILQSMRLDCDWMSQLALPDGRRVAINPVRAQWTGRWAASLGMARRHDVACLRPDGEGLHVELELKTSHSDSHNWFRKTEVEHEMSAMALLMASGHLDHGSFVLYRYGKAMWEDDRDALARRYPRVEMRYLCA